MPTTSVLALSPEELHHTYLTIHRFGGSFLRALADAMIKADPGNRDRLIQAFPEVINLYGPRSDFYSKTREQVTALAQECG